MTDNTLTDVQKERLLTKEAHKLSIAKNIHIDTAKKILRKREIGNSNQAIIAQLSDLTQDSDFELQDANIILQEMLTILSKMSDTVYNEKV